MRKIAEIILFIVPIFILSACGIKVFQSIDPPINANNPNIANGNEITSPELLNKFSFTAQDLSSLLNPGTDVYYRIYKSQTDLQKDAKIINDANIEDTENGAQKLFSLNYQKILSNTTGRGNPLINENGGTIEITLANLDSDRAFISVMNTIPLRYNNKYFNFDTEYNKGNDSYAIPRSGDSDFQDSSSSSGYYFVNLYAVSTGMDTTIYKPIYSELLSLGFLYYEAK